MLAARARANSSRSAPFVCPYTRDRIHGTCSSTPRPCARRRPRIGALTRPWTRPEAAVCPTMAKCGLARRKPSRKPHPAAAPRRLHKPATAAATPPNLRRQAPGPIKSATDPRARGVPVESSIGRDCRCSWSAPCFLLLLLRPSLRRARDQSRHLLDHRSPISLWQPLPEHGEIVPAKIKRYLSLYGHGPPSRPTCQHA